MDPLSDFLLQLALIGAGVLAASMGQRRLRRNTLRLRAWTAAAKKAGVTQLLVLDDDTQKTLVGSAGPLDVRVEIWRSGRRQRATRLSIDSSAHRAQTLSVQLESLGTTLDRRLLGATEVEVGDAYFDLECFVRAPAALALAVLDSATRADLRSLLTGLLQTDRGEAARVHASLRAGVLALEVDEDVSPGHLARVRLLTAALRVARKLVPPDDLAAALAQKLQAEPEPGVRLRLVQTLQREYPDHGSTADALRRACDDADTEVRLWAATALRGEGRDTLLGLVRDRRTADSARARALRALGGHAGGDLAAQVLASALEGQQFESAQASLERLRSVPSPEVEPLVVRAVASADRGVMVAAASVLRAWGSVAAVAALRERARESEPSEVRHAARQAIDAIQARTHGASPGQLTIADGEQGALSLPDVEGNTAGQLSLPGDDEPPAARLGGSPGEAGTGATLDGPQREETR